MLFDLVLSEAEKEEIGDADEGGDPFCGESESDAETGEGEWGGDVWEIPALETQNSGAVRFRSWVCLWVL